MVGAVEISMQIGPVTICVLESEMMEGEEGEAFHFHYSNHIETFFRPKMAGAQWLVRDGPKPIAAARASQSPLLEIA